MNWIVAMIICFGTTCQPGWIPDDKFQLKADCEMYAEIYSSKAQQAYPDSTGQLFCITENVLEDARANAEKEGFILKPAPSLTVMMKYLEANPPAPTPDTNDKK
jgi:hypothetical protein